jgi:hypothetical protein
MDLLILKLVKYIFHLRSNSFRSIIILNHRPLQDLASAPQEVGGELNGELSQISPLVHSPFKFYLLCTSQMACWRLSLPPPQIMLRKFGQCDLHFLF